MKKDEAVEMENGIERKEEVKQEKKEETRRKQKEEGGLKESEEEDKLGDKRKSG